MDIKENKRLKEIKLSIYLNHIDKIENKTVYSTMIKILGCVVAVFGKEYYNTFTNILQLSLNECFVKATNKELIATCLTYFSKSKSASKLGIASSTFYSRYNDLLNRDFITEDFINSLSPMFTSTDDQFIIDFLINFIEKFKIGLGNDEHAIKNKERTLEIEFYLIYNKLMECSQSASFCDKFIFNICNAFEIDYSTIAHLKNNLHVISRAFPNFRYNNRYFMQEIVYLYSLKGLNKSAISTKILGKDYSFLYRGTNKKYNDLVNSEDISWQYAPTISWESIKKEDVVKFINTLHIWLRHNV